ncbi:MAG: hypothetical protein Q7T55_04415 [Solirubrobacteraceae bacterium]|nr:hypothetical protein [Solirubrobacteraceae bacterium]
MTAFAEGPGATPVLASSAATTDAARLRAGRARSPVDHDRSLGAAG